ncbi:MAG: hypothetical protein EA350_14630 [Gemmatimonadales bacterium]|nr:MAG: hypothetical protein EA350_14630 [Gemmatimonadales bacterium]
MTGCDNLGDSPLAAPLLPTGPSATLQDATAGGSAGFYFLPPLTADPLVSGKADLTRSPRVVICEVYDAGLGTCTRDLITFQGSDITVTGESYAVVWSGRDTGVVLDWPYRVSVHVGAYEFGHAEVRFMQNAFKARGQTELTFVGTQRSIPIRFRIEEGALIAAAIESECDVDGTTILDCDVQEASPETETTAVVEDTDGNVAGLVILPPGAVTENALLVLKHLGNPIDGTTINETDQIPFFLRVKVTDIDGNDLTLLEKAALVVCQNPNLHVHGPAMAKLKIFRLTSAQQTEILATNVGDPRCAGFGVASTQRPASFMGRLRADLKSSVAFLFGPQPLSALHGGLNTTLESFSDFGAVVIESTPIAYGSTWEWSTGANSGSGPSPFTTTSWNSGTCPDLNLLRPSGTSNVWPLGSNSTPSVITLTKEFTLPAHATGATVWAAIDNDIRVFVNGVDVTPGFQIGQTNNGELGSDGWLTHENCTMPDAYSFPVPATAVNSGGVNTLTIHARDRGTIGFVDVRIDAVLP